MYQHACLSHCRQHAYLGGPDGCAFVQDQVATAHVLARWAYAIALVYANINQYIAADPGGFGPCLGLAAGRVQGEAVAGVLEANDSVSACGNGCSRHDAEGSAGSHLVVWAGGCGCWTVGDHSQRSGALAARSGNVFGSHRITVHCRVVKRRQVGIAIHVLSEHQAKRVRKRHGYRFQGRKIAQDSLKRFLHADAGEGGGGSVHVDIITRIA